MSHHVDGTDALAGAGAVDVLICGAGAAGLTLAIDLARRGVAFRLIDKADRPFPGSRGKAVQPRTLEVFEDLGIVERVAALGGPYPPQREYREDGTVVDAAVMEHGTATPAEPYPAPVMVAQFLTERVLRARLVELGARPEFATELVGLDQDSDGVTARVSTPAGETTIRATYLVGADGGRSVVRHSLDVGFLGKALGVRAVVADLMLTGLDRDFWHRFGGGSRAKSVSLCPLVGTEMFQLQAPVPPDVEVDLTAAGLQQLIATRTGRTDIAIHSVSWASVFSPQARLADAYRTGRVFLVGDAAHVHPPTGGQGLNTSIQDAYNLGWKLAAVLGGAPQALLDTYHEERHPVAAEMLGLSTKLLDAVKRGDIRRGREVHQLDLGYPASSLALEVPARQGGALAGDRAPDAPVTAADGADVRLFELFAGPHWTLLGYEVKGEPFAAHTGLRVHVVGPDGDLEDTGGHLRAAYGLDSGDWALVRPDGYLAAIVADDRRAELTAYLRAVGVEPSVAP